MSLPLPIPAENEAANDRRDKKNKTQERHPDNRAAENLSQDVVPSPCHDRAREGPPHPRKYVEGRMSHLIVR